MLLPPAADAAGRAGSFRNLTNCVKAWIVCHINQGAAAPVTLAPMQALSNAGLDALSIGPAGIFYNANTALSDQLVPQPAAASFTTEAGIEDKIVIFVIEPQDCMNMALFYTYVSVTTSASDPANITAGMLRVLRAEQGANPPSSYT
jgi:hypothetical protein